jgi:hypothetical protein
MIDRQTLENFRQDFNEAMKDLEQKYGFVIELGRITYTPTSFTGKLEVHEGESKDDVNEQEFKKYCYMFGLDEQDYDRRFTFQGKDYIVTGIRPSKRKYPICCQEVQSGTTCGFTSECVRKALGK